MLNNSYNKNNSTPQKAQQQQSPPPVTHGNQFGGKGKDQIKWKLFLRDFITWLIIMLVLYLLWKYLLHPYKLKNSLNVPSTNTQYIPMSATNAGMGKNVKKF
jgi:hypothetical protein